jgi:hypothetical protein
VRTDDHLETRLGHGFDQHTVECDSRLCGSDIALQHRPLRPQRGFVGDTDNHAAGVTLMQRAALCAFSTTG